MSSFEELYRRRCRSFIGCFETGDTVLRGPYLVFGAIEKAQLIRERLKIAQSGQKSYVDVRRKDLEF